MGTFVVGLSALQVAQAGLITTQHNIANASTPGYHRQQIIQGASVPEQTGVGFLGQGVQVTAVKRLYSQFLTDQVMQTEAQGEYLNAFNGEIKQVDNLLADPNAGLSPAVQEFFSSIQELASNPSSAPARQAVLSQGQTLVNRFNSMNQQLSNIRQDVNTQVSDTVTQINSTAKQIATLNEQVVIAQKSAGSDSPPNDLLDQRDQLIADLNKLVKTSVVKQYDGTLNVYIGTGQALVVGQSSFNLTVNQSAEDPDNLVIGYNSNNGTTNTLISSSSLGGGALGGLLDFRSSILETAQNSLGRVAVGLAETFNNQQKLGVDLNGVLGKNFFNIASTSPTVSSNANNTSGVSMSAVFDPTAAGALTTGSYRLTYDSVAASYTVTDLISNTSSTVAAASLSTAIGGITLSASGTPNNGESFLVLPTRNAARDISLAISNTSDIAAAVPIKTAASLSNTGTGQISTGGVTSVATLPTANVTLTYNSATSTFTTASTQASYNGLSVPYTSGSTISFNGVNFVITGVPANTDSFTIAPNSGASFTALNDNGNALQLAKLQSANTLINNSAGTAATATYQSAYSQLVSLVGIKSHEISVRAQAQTTLVDQVRQQEQSLSGVNLDEEAANLLRYQQAYQAASKGLEISSKLFDTILAIG